MTTMLKNLICFKPGKQGSRVLAAGHTIEFDADGIARNVHPEAAAKLLAGKAYGEWDGRSPRQVLKESRAAEAAAKAEAHQQALRRNIDLAMESGLGTRVQELVCELLRDMGFDPEALQQTKDGMAQITAMTNGRRAELAGGAAMTPTPKSGKMVKQPSQVLPPAPTPEVETADEPGGSETADEPGGSETAEVKYVGDSGASYTIPGEGEEWPDPVEDMPMTYLKECAVAYDLKHAGNISKIKLVAALHEAMYA